jgi:hypothetical protein
LLQAFLIRWPHLLACLVPGVAQPPAAYDCAGQTRRSARQMPWNTRVLRCNTRTVRSNSSNRRWVHVRPRALWCGLHGSVARVFWRSRVGIHTARHGGTVVCGKASRSGLIAVAHAQLPGVASAKMACVPRRGAEARVEYPGHARAQARPALLAGRAGQGRPSFSARRRNHVKSRAG